MNSDQHAGTDARPTEVFVASPIGSPDTPGHTTARKVLEYIIRKALPKPEWRVTRADDDQAPDSITQKVVRRIIEADLVVVDITNHNPNVFYELAIAHCYKKPVVIIAAVGTSSPFDVVDQTRIDYDLSDPASVYGSQERVIAAARLALEDPESLVTPLSTFTAVSASAERLESGDSGEFVEILGTLGSRLSRIEDQLSRLAPKRSSYINQLKVRSMSSNVDDLDLDLAPVSIMEFVTEISEQVDSADLRTLVSWLNNLEPRADSDNNTLQERRELRNLVRRIRAEIERRETPGANL